jgi:valyl-tRNA synthetase
VTDPSNDDRFYLFMHCDRIPVYYVFHNDDCSASNSSENSESLNSAVDNAYRDGRIIVAKSHEDALKHAKLKYGPHVTVKQETDVLDTWFR